MEDSRVSVESFEMVKDPKLCKYEIAPYLRNIFFKITKECLMRHSKRLSSTQVYLDFGLLHNYTNTLNYYRLYYYRL